MTTTERTHTNPDGTEVIVNIGYSVSIGSGVTIGENVTIGDGSVIDEYAEIGDSVTIGETVVICAYVIVGASVSIGAHTVVKIGATINEAADIEWGCVISAQVEVPSFWTTPRSTIVNRQPSGDILMTPRKW
jgi:UDP-3-O-[3-hydroxymyristoyl] glucosamine N-acyltransferase